MVGQGLLGNPLRGRHLVGDTAPASYLGCPIDILSMAETVELARRAMRDRKRLQYVAFSVAKFVNMPSIQWLPPMWPIA